MRSRLRWRSVAAPLFVGDPLAMDPQNRLPGLSTGFWFGTDSLGRDVFARTVFGARISLLVDFTVAVAAVMGGLLIGLAAGYLRRIDGVAMRVMDGLMSIPSILLAIAFVSLTHADAWHFLVGDPDRITTIAHRHWACANVSGG